MEDGAATMLTSHSDLTDALVSRHSCYQNILLCLEGGWEEVNREVGRREGGSSLLLVWLALGFSERNIPESS